jgi:sulfur-carrier protein
MPHHVTVHLPASLQQYSDGRRKFVIVADSVRSAVESLADQAPGLRQHMLDESGRLRPFINLFVDNQQVIDLEADGKELRDGSELLVVAAVAGG